MVPEQGVSFFSFALRKACSLFAKTLRFSYGVPAGGSVTVNSTLLSALAAEIAPPCSSTTVSYTHLDVYKRQAEDNSLPLLRKRLADTNRGIENILNAIQQGILTSSTKERLEELEKLREELTTSILQAELEKPKYSREDIVEWISRFKYGDTNNKEYQRQIIDIFLNSIYVFDDRLVFTYNYKNGTQTVTLADVSAAFGSDLKSPPPPRRSKLCIACSDFLYEENHSQGEWFKRRLMPMM